MSRLSTLLGIASILAILASGCNLQFAQAPDTAAVQTGAALTVEAALTGAAPTATNTPPPFPTVPTATSTVPGPTSAPAVTPTSSCDAASFITDVTYPDGTEVNAGDSFTKTWRLRNVGSCSWTPSYALVFTGGEAMAGPAAQSLVGNVNPGQTVDVSVALTAPAADGTHTGNWALRNAAGVIFSHFYVQISVGAAVTSAPPAAFAVIHVTYSLSTITDGSNTDCPNVTAHITTNAAGDVQYHFTRSDNASAPVQTLHFGSAGTQDVSEAWYLGHVWNGTSNWLGVYIDSPNHQDFGHKEFTTACTSP